MKQVSRHAPCATQSVAIDTKQITDTGSFEGWASTYGNVDAGGDKVMPGAFASSLRKSDRVRLLLNHDPDKLVGWASLEDRPDGLFLRGQLDLLDPSGLGKYVHHKMLTGELSALSIGYSVERGGARITDEGVRELTSLKLWEVSIVAFPMNELATVTNVKSGRRISEASRKRIQAAIDELLALLAEEDDAEDAKAQPKPNISFDIADILSEVRSLGAIR